MDDRIARIIPVLVLTLGMSSVIGREGMCREGGPMYDDPVAVLMVAEGWSEAPPRTIVVDPYRSQGRGVLAYNIDFGDGTPASTGTLETSKEWIQREALLVLHTYTSTQTYSLRLTIIDERGMSDTLSVAVKPSDSRTKKDLRVREVRNSGDRVVETVWKSVERADEQAGIDVTRRDVESTTRSPGERPEAEAKDEGDTPKWREHMTTSPQGHPFCPWFISKGPSYPAGGGDYFMDRDSQWGQLGWDRTNTLEIDAARIYDDNEEGSGGWYANWHLWVIPFEGRWSQTIRIPVSGQFSLAKAIQKGWLPPSSKDLYLRGPYWSGDKNEWGNTGSIGAHGTIYWSFYAWDWANWGLGTATDVALYLWEGDECWGPFCNGDDPIALFQVNKALSLGRYVFLDDSDSPPWGLLKNWDGFDVWLQYHTIRK